MFLKQIKNYFIQFLHVFCTKNSLIFFIAQNLVIDLHHMTQMLKTKS